LSTKLTIIISSPAVSADMASFATTVTNDSTILSITRPIDIR
jgi:hypothetical protein